MKKMTLTIAVAATALAAHAQRMMGVATSNWSATQGLYLNPANIADSRTRFSLDLFALNFGIDNNMASVNLQQATQSTGGVSNAGSLLTFSKNKQFNIVMPQAEVRLPGFMYQVDHNNSFAVTTRLRVFNQFNNFDQTLFRTIMDPAFASATTYPFTSNKFNWTANIWTEFNLSYARVLYEKGPHMVKAGITLGRMSGVGFLSVKGNNLDATYYGYNDSLRATNTNVEFASNIVDSVNKLGSGFDNIADQFFGKKGGGGWRADIGAVYEYRPDNFDPNDHAVNKYKVRASVAITDLGSIKYKNVAYTRITGNGSMSAGDLARNFTNYNNLTTYMNSRGFTLDTGRGATTKVGLPTTLVLGADYYVAGPLYVNATWIKNMANRQKFGNSYYGQLTITPRVDTRFASLAIPITYSGMTKGIKAGAGIRLGGLFFGSDDMLVFFSKKQYGINFYMGGYIPINRKHPKHHSDSNSSTNTSTEAPKDNTTK